MSREELLREMSLAGAERAETLKLTLDEINESIDKVDAKIAVLDAARADRRAERVTTAVDVTGAVAEDDKVGAVATALGGPAAGTGLAVLGIALKAWAARRRERG